MTLAYSQSHRTRTSLSAVFLILAIALVGSMTMTGPRAGRAAESAGPDLTVEIALIPPAPAANQEVTIRVTARNNGSSDASGQVRVHLFVDPVDRPPTTTTAGAFPLISIPGLPAGGSSAADRTHTFTTGGCGHVIYAWIDRDNGIAESDETNNLIPLTVCIDVECAPDPHEEDNLCSVSGLLLDNASQARSFCNVQNKSAPDEDWVKFTVFSGVTYTLATSNQADHAAPELELYNACGATPLKEDADQVTWQAPASGVVYGRIANAGGVTGPLTAYSLTLSSLTGVTDPYEADNRCDDARDITTDGATQTHLFQAPADEDWVKFSIGAGESFIMLANHTATGVEPVISVFTSCSQVASNASLGPSAAQVAESSAVAAVYYARVKNQNAQTFGAEAHYDLAVTAGACTPDTAEEDEPAAGAKEITVGAAVTHNSCPASDEDWVKFTAQAGQVYVMQTTNLAFAADTVIHLYDTNGTTELAQNDDYGYSSGSRLVWQAATAGVYFVKIQHANPVASGPNTQYDFVVQEGACAPDAQEGSAGDNGPGDAALLPANGVTQTHNFCADALSTTLGDQDWVRFPAVINGNYRIETADLGPNSDTVLELFGPDGATQLLNNDDDGPGRSATLNFTATVPGDYFVRITQYNTNITGGETDYGMRLLANEPPPPTPTPSPTPLPPPIPTPTPTPNMVDVETLILVNRTQVSALYGAAQSAALMAKVATLANHEAVKGAVIQVDTASAVAAAYADWTSDQNTLQDNDKANAVSAAIRNLVMGFVAGGPNVRHIVIVGDDRIIPFRRVPDQVQTGDLGPSATGVLEEEYAASVGLNTTVAAALAANNILTDDYYGDQTLGEWKDKQGNTYPLYVADYAMSRLVETPAEITGVIDQFLTTQVITTNNVLVTGYDFVQDGADSIQKQFTNDALTTNKTLIGSFWPGATLRTLQLGAVPRYDLQSINGHSTHLAAGTPDKKNIQASEIITASADLAGALIFSIGCHGGLNDPSQLDLAEAFMSRRAYYVGNTGYGWGGSGIVLTEKLMTLYTRELVRGARAEIGPALRAAKQKYASTEQTFDAFDAKVLMQMTFYGLPMVEITSGAILDDDNPFPSADTSISPPSAFGELNEGAVGYNVAGAGAFGDNSNPAGSYLDLDGSVDFDAGSPVQPLFYADVSAPPAGELRGVLFLGGAYTDQPNFDPVMAQADNEYVDVGEEPTLAASGWTPAVPFAVRSSTTFSATSDTVVMSLGQFQPGEDGPATERVYTQMSFGTYYSQSPDRKAANIQFVDGVLKAAAGKATIKVETSDDSGIQRVVVAYTGGEGSWASQDLSFDEGTQKWTTEVTATLETRYFVQVVDKAGNVAVNSNKGHYYPLLPPLALAPGRGLDIERRVFLPVIVR